MKAETVNLRVETSFGAERTIRSDKARF